MAKAKKQNLPIEVLLEQALVPEDEQPYEVPENWIWVYGKVAFGQVESKKPTGDYFKYIDIESIDNKSQKVLEPKTIAVSEAPSRASRKLHSGDTLFSLVRPYLRNIAYIDSSLADCIASTGFNVCHPNKAFVGRYIYHLMTSEYIVTGLNAYMKGDNSPSIRKDDIENFAYPLPPLAEQLRIVDRIETLLAKLDQAKELAQNALDTFETRKAAILHKAFSGELTVKWREEHGVEVDSWERKPLGDDCLSLQYGTSKKSQSIGKVAVVRMGNLQDGEIIWDNLAYTDDEEDIKKYILRSGDVLFNRTNSPELVGKTSIYRGEFPAIYAGYLIRLNYTNKIYGEYLNYVMNSLSAKEYCNTVKIDGVNQSNINAKKIAAFIIPVPTLAEQQEIVRILDSLFGKEQKAKELFDVIDKIDLMKKSILDRAFRGELGTNDPADESAVELLKDMLTNK